MNNKLEYTGFWVRFIAQIVDILLLLLILLPMFIILSYDTSFSYITYFMDDYWDYFYDYSPFTIYIDYVLPFLITMLFWILFQATPGKIAFRAKIVDAKTGKKPSVGQYIIRYLGYIPATLFLGLGILWIAFDKRKQGWHDKLAGTVVVRNKNKEEVKFY